MPVSASRSAAFKILLRVEEQDSYAAELLHSSQFANLSRADHGLATELVMGVLRWRSSLDRGIAKASSLPLQKLDAEVLTALRLAVYQLQFLDRIPARAAVNESVELVKRSHKGSAVPFANAVLRKFSARLPEFKDSLAPDDESVAQLADRLSHPEWLLERWLREYGEQIAQTICEYDQKVPETAIRLRDDKVEAELERDGITLVPGKMLISARRVLAGDVTNTSAFREGRVSIQDEASQLVALLVGKAYSILDCCAAPGGKTRVLAERNPDAKVLALDLHPNRARLVRRLVPFRNVNVIAANAVTVPTTAVFEAVLVDVPCSGTGTLARNPDIKWRLTEDDIADLQPRQIAILQSAMRCVAPGGRLVYSTCSLEREENSDVVEKALAADNSFRGIDCQQVLEELRAEGELSTEFDSSIASQYLRTIPGIQQCDGFFAAILKKA